MHSLTPASAPVLGFSRGQGIAHSRRLKERFGLERVVLVGDRGLLPQVQIEHLKRHRGLGWVNALKATQVRALVEPEHGAHLQHQIGVQEPGDRRVHALLSSENSTGR